MQPVQFPQLLVLDNPNSEANQIDFEQGANFCAMRPHDFATAVGDERYGAECARVDTIIEEHEDRLREAEEAYEEQDSIVDGLRDELNDIEPGREPSEPSRPSSNDPDALDRYRRNLNEYSNEKTEWSQKKGEQRAKQAELKSAEAQLERLDKAKDRVEQALDRAKEQGDAAKTRALDADALDALRSEKPITVTDDDPWTKAALQALRCEFLDNYYRNSSALDLTNTVAAIKAIQPREAALLDELLKHEKVRAKRADILRTAVAHLEDFNAPLDLIVGELEKVPNPKTILDALTELLNQPVPDAGRVDHLLDPAKMAAMARQLTEDVSALELQKVELQKLHAPLQGLHELAKAAQERLGIEYNKLSAVNVEQEQSKFEWEIVSHLLVEFDVPAHSRRHLNNIPMGADAFSGAAHALGQWLCSGTLLAWAKNQIATPSAFKLQPALDSLSKRLAGIDASLALHRARQATLDDLPLSHQSQFRKSASLSNTLSWIPFMAPVAMAMSVHRIHKFRHVLRSEHALYQQMRSEVAEDAIGKATIPTILALLIVGALAWWLRGTTGGIFFGALAFICGLLPLAAALFVQKIAGALDSKFLATGGAFTAIGLAVLLMSYLGGANHTPGTSEQASSQTLEEAQSNESTNFGQSASNAESDPPPPPPPPQFDQRTITQLLVGSWRDENSTCTYFERGDLECIVDGKPLSRRWELNGNELEWFGGNKRYLYQLVSIDAQNMVLENILPENARGKRWYSTRN